MSADIVAVRETSTVEEAIQHIRKTVTEERPFGVYAVDDHGHLIGRVPLRRLLLANPRSVIVGILEEDVVSVNATMDKEEVARLVAKYDLVTVPVVDEQNRLVGTISVDDAIDIVQEEASEDIFRMAGSDAAELGEKGIRFNAALALAHRGSSLAADCLDLEPPPPEDRQARA